MTFKYDTDEESLHPYRSIAGACLPITLPPCEVIEQMTFAELDAFSKTFKKAAEDYMLLLLINRDVQRLLEQNLPYADYEGEVELVVK